ncbi:hypothetical protein Tco_0347681 [Tanacetum coccineum]
MDDPNITMKEYIRLEEEKARRHARTFNWQTATYRKMEYYENEDDSFTNLETEYPAIVFAINPMQHSHVNICIDKVLGQTDMAPLPHRDLRHPWLRYQVEGYARTLGDRLSMIYTRDDGQALFTSHAWRRLFEIRGPLVREFIMEFLSTSRMSDMDMGLDVADTLCFQLSRARRKMTWRQFILALGLHTEEKMADAGFGAYWQGSERVIPEKRDLIDYWIKILSDRDFLRHASSHVFIRDPVRRLCHKIIDCSISGRRQAPKKVTGVDLFYLRSMDRGTANVASRPERQKAAATGAPRAAEDTPTADKGAQIERIEEEVCKLQKSIIGLRGVVKSSITKKTRVSTWMISCMTQLMDVSSRTYQAFDNIIIGSSLVPYQRRVRPRTGDANTSIAPHTNDQPDP